MSELKSLPKPGRKKIIIFIILLFGAFLVFNFLAKPKIQPLQFATVKKEDIASTVSSSGSLTGKNTVDLKFKSSGKLAYLNVKAGDKVSKYQAIAGLDTQALSIDLQQAYNILRDKEAIKEKAEDDVKGHDKDESFAQKVTRTTAEVAKDNAYDDVKAAQKALADAVITSPIEGIVIQAEFIPGQIVGASDVIARIVDFSEFFFDTDIDEADIGKIALGQKTRVALDAYPQREFEGAVSEIIPQIITTSSGANVVKVRINLGNPDITPVNGLSGQASIILSEAKDVLILPLEAVRDNDTVVIKTQQGLKEQKVTTGIKSDTDVEIKEGLNEGEKILLNPPAK